MSGKRESIVPTSEYPRGQMAIPKEVSKVKMNIEFYKPRAQRVNEFIGS